jgi:4-hydroxybutyryl-CoA dehydratase/vinylacetyl-CoA-Delta-isomerase
VVTLPSPEEDHNPETGADLAAVLQARPEVPYAKRAQVARFIEDITASYSGGWMSTISLHGGGSPEAMKREIHRRYPIVERQQLVERLMNRGALSDNPAESEQPGQCCDTGCTPPEAPVVPEVSGLGD